jgi:hypothetical protein
VGNALKHNLAPAVLHYSLVQRQISWILCR